MEVSWKHFLKINRVMTNSQLRKQTKEFVNHVIQNADLTKPLVFWIDLFCGAGGTSTGIHFTDIANMFVAACVNHDANAILSHELNHPHTLHFTEDIRDFEVVKKLKYLVNELRKAFPNCKINIWASLECTNFSKAKGGQARDADSRTLAEHMFMYIQQLDPDYFWVENVREFMSWGPLDNNGKPVSRTAGQDYIKWIEGIMSHGYQYDKKILNSANYGAYQSRERLFIQFAKYDYPIQWPEQTHTKDKVESPLFPMQRWKPVREVLDLSDEGVSIFQRKKELSDNTLKRIYAGLLKFVANGDGGFTKQYNSGDDEHRVKSLEEPIGTLTTGNSHAVVKSVFMTQRNSGEPNSKLINVDYPTRTVTTTGGNQEIVTASHLNTYYGNGGVHSIDNPSPTITTKDRIAKVDVNFIDQQYGNSTAASIDKPIGTLTINPKFNLVKAKNYIYNPSWGGNNGSIENPCCTIVARQDKSPLYLITTELGHLTIPVFEKDSDIMIKIKKFMVAHSIIDIKMRMLNIPELKQIQGFSKDYKLIGNQTEQKKFIGNAVEVNQAKALIKCNYTSIENHLKKAAT